MVQQGTSKDKEMTYSIKQIADLAGVTPRTLRYYDEIGLLNPSMKGENKYRYYDQSSLLRLQQILFFRELDIPLKDIQLIMSQPEFNLVSALQNHREALKSRAARLETLIDTLNQTISVIQGEGMMSNEELFEGFDEKKYEEEAKKRWGDSPRYAESQAKWRSYSEEKRKAIKVEGGVLFLRMVTENPKTSPDDQDVQAAIGEYLAYLNKNFYACDAEFLRVLADSWVQDSRFAVNFEQIREGGAEFVREAVHYFCDNRE